MVYSTELGYDPEEWEECAEPEHFLAMSMFTRVCLTMGTILASALFFWLLEVNKRRHRRGSTIAGEGSKMPVAKDDINGAQEETAEKRLEKASQQAEQMARYERPRSNSKRALTEDEELQLLEWEDELRKIEQERLRASEEPPAIRNEEKRRAASEELQMPTELKQQELVEPENDRRKCTIEDEGKMEKGGEDKQKQIWAEETHENRVWTGGEEMPGAEVNRQQNVLFEVADHSSPEECPAGMTSEAMGPAGEDKHEYHFVADEREPMASRGAIPLAEHTTKQPKDVEGPAPFIGKSHSEDENLGMKSAEVAKPKELTTWLSPAECAPGATPPSTPPCGVPSAEGLPELAAYYRQMADHLTQKLLTELEEMGNVGELDSPTVTAELQNRHRGQIDGALQQETGISLKIRKQLADQLESHMASVVRQEIRRRSSSNIVFFGRSADDQKTKEGKIGGEEDIGEQQMAESADEEKQGKKGSSSSEEAGFVKIHRRTLPQAEEGVQLTEGHQQRMSPQLGTTDDEEGPPQEDVRVSLFSAEGEGDGMSTIADDIEFMPSGGVPPSPPPQKIGEMSAEEKEKGTLNAKEAEQMIALLREYDLTGAHEGGTQEERRATVGPTDSARNTGGVISLPESAQRTPAEVASVPESPGSMDFDFVCFPAPLSSENIGVEVETDPTKMVKLPIDVVERQEENGEPALEGVELVELKQHRTDVHQPPVDLQWPKQMGQGSQPPLIQQQSEQEQFLKEALSPLERQQQLEKDPERKPQTQKSPPSVMKQSTESGHSAFVVEEEMLESEEDNLNRAGKAEKARAGQSAREPTAGTWTIGADGTSKQMRTNEVFDRPDPILITDDGDDKDMTYAPEIQSMEVPPDQLSQADSLNLVDENFSEHHDIIQPLEYNALELVEEKAMEQKRQSFDGDYEDKRAEEEPLAGEHVPRNQRELTPKTEEELHREIDLLRRTPSPRLPDQTRRQIPQAPQFLRSYFNDESTSSLSSTSFRQTSLLSALGVSSMQEMLLRLDSFEALSEAMRKAGLESSNLIFGIDYTASNKYQGEHSFGGRSLHSLGHPSMENPYQQVIRIMGRTLAPFANNENGVPVFGFGDSTTGDWSVFTLNGESEGECEDLNDVLRVYNRTTPQIELSGPTNFAPLIYRSIEICHKRKDYHILVIIADGQVTNEKATRKAIVSACRYPLSIIVVGVGDGPWEMMKVFDESLPKRPWDNFHFVEFHQIMNEQIGAVESKDLAFAVHSLLEIPDQYATIRKLGMLLPTYYTRSQPHSPRSHSPKLQTRIK